MSFSLQHSIFTFNLQWWLNDSVNKGCNINKKHHKNRNIIKIKCNNFLFYDQISCAVYRRSQVFSPQIANRRPFWAPVQFTNMLRILRLINNCKFNFLKMYFKDFSKKFQLLFAVILFFSWNLPRVFNRISQSLQMLTSM